MRPVPAINYEIPEELHMRAKAAAAMRGMTLKAYVIAAIEQMVAAEPPPPKPTRAKKKAG